MDLVNILVWDFCGNENTMTLLQIVGYVVFAIKIVVPIMLIIVGMIGLAKAVAGKDESEVKKAQQELVKKAIAAVLVFLVVTIVSILMSVVNGNAYEKCMDCVNHPFSKVYCNAKGLPPE